MGYYTRFFGDIAIHPPLPWSKIKNSPFIPQGDGRFPNRDLRIVVTEETVEIDEGTLHRKVGVSIEATSGDGTKAYSIVEHLDELLRLHGDGHTFTGYITAEGEDAGDLWRLTVEGGKAVKIQPRIIWPDGSEEPRR